MRNLSNKSPQMHTTQQLKFTDNPTDKSAQKAQTPHIKILDIPFNHHQMTAGISLTGITVLTQSAYKSRHSLNKELSQIPGVGIVLKKDDYTLKKVVKKKKRVLKKSIFEEVIRVKSDPKEKFYQVNKKEVTHRIRNFVNFMRGKKELYFWSVTFPLATSDDTAFLLMNKWLTRLRQEKMLRSYLWITERQKNGTIHFHMAVNHRMDVKKANKFMRACLFTCIDNQEIIYSRADAVKYNGIDISKDRKTGRVTNFAKKSKDRSLVAYLTKYVTKNQESFKHLAWHSSRDYSHIVIQFRLTESELLKSQILLLCDDSKIFVNEWFVFHPWKGGPPGQVTRYLSDINYHISLLN